MFPYSKIEEKIGYVFRNKELLKEAFTHSTYANVHGGADNERLEYFGDAVLQLVVTEWQFAKNGKATEGEMTRERQKLVCEEALDSAVEKLGVEKYLLKEGGSANVGKKTVSSLFETLTAAIYLDGGYTKAKKFILKHGVLQTQALAKNPKSELQELLQKTGEELPVYQTQKSGKDNAPIFRCEATANGVIGKGEGRSKKEAEQAAAKSLLEILSKKRKK